MTVGHVFLIRGDLRALQCDAIGYSGNPYNNPSRRWQDDVKGAPLPAESRIDEDRVVRRWSGTDDDMSSPSRARRPRRSAGTSTRSVCSSSAPRPT